MLCLVHWWWPRQCVSVQGPRLVVLQRQVVKLSEPQLLQPQQDTWTTGMDLLGQPTFTQDGKTFPGLLLGNPEGWATIPPVPRCATSGCLHQHLLAPSVSCWLSVSNSRREGGTYLGSKVTLLPHRHFLGISQFGRQIKSLPIAWNGRMVKNIIIATS